MGSLKARILAWVVVIMLPHYGCSSARPPIELLSRAELGLRAASVAGAADHAPMELRSAETKLERAKRAAATKRYEEANRFAEHALVDAEFAEAKAEAEIARHAAEELRISIEALRAEVERAAGR